MLTFVAGAAALLWRVGVRSCWTYTKALATMPLVVDKSFKMVTQLSNDTSVNGAVIHILLHHFGKPIWRSGPSGNALWCNDVMLRLLGRTMDDIEGEGWRSIIAEDDRERVTREWQSCMEQDRKFDMTYSWLDAKGGLVPIHATAHILRDELGNRVGWLGIVNVL